MKYLFLVLWFIIVIACIGALVLFAIYRGCMTLFCILVMVSGMLIGMYVGEQYDGGIITPLAGAIGWLISYGVLFVILVGYDIIFCPFPYRKKCELRTCHPHYYNWIQIEKDIWYRECYICHQEYVLVCFKYEIAVNADGTLQPYLKRTKRGWKKNEAIDPETLALLTPEVINQMRKSGKNNRIFVHRVSPTLKPGDYDYSDFLVK